MCGRPANISFVAYYYDPGFMHHLRVDGLGEEEGGGGGGEGRGGYRRIVSQVAKRREVSGLYLQPRSFCKYQLR